MAKKTATQNLSVTEFINNIRALPWGSSIDNRTFLRAYVHLTFIGLAIGLVVGLLMLLVEVLNLPKPAVFVPIAFGVVAGLWVIIQDIKILMARVQDFNISGFWYILNLVLMMATAAGLEMQGGTSHKLHLLVVAFTILNLAFTYYLAFVPGLAKKRYAAASIYPNRHISWPVKLMTGFFICTNIGSAVIVTSEFLSTL